MQASIPMMIQNAGCSGAHARARGIPLAANPCEGPVALVWRHGWLGQAAYELGRAHGGIRRKPGRRILAMNPSVLERYLTGWYTAANNPREPHKWTRRRHRPEAQ